MTKFKNILSRSLAPLLLCVFALNSRAQRGFDEFGSTATLILMVPTNLVYATPVVSNTPMAINMLTGIGKLDVTTWTNGGGTLTLNCYSSMDLTNWTLVPNYATLTNLTFRYTNNMFGNTNLIATNSWNLAYNVTAGNATNGFTTSFNSYPAAQQFTNTFPLTITKNGIYSIGLSMDDIGGKYFVAVISGTGGNTNDVASAILTAQPQSQLYPTQ